MGRRAPSESEEPGILNRVDDQVIAPVGPPTDSQWPPDAPGGEVPPRKPFPRWGKWLAGFSVLVIIASVAGSMIRLPYDTLAPGGTLNLASRVSVSGAKVYPDRGDLRLLFVRERTHVNVWSWLQAKLDPEIDLVKQNLVTGGRPQKFANEQDVCDMTQAQNSARVSALEALGYKVPVVPGLDVVDLAADLPAINVLQPCDEIIAANGRELKQPNDLSKIVQSQEVGTAVELRIKRAGRELTVRVPVKQVNGRHLIGVGLALRYKVPVQIKIDTSDISGPSAGLAMALATIDALTPGELTGGKRVAVTGTIDPQGNVGEIGGLPQKAVAARAAHAQVFIVPECADRSKKSACEMDLAVAKRRVGKDVVLVPVSTLAGALKALRAAGGVPVAAPATTTG
jgi:PDZ domain-containing protein